MSPTTFDTLTSCVSGCESRGLLRPSLTPRVCAGSYTAFNTQSGAEVHQAPGGGRYHVGLAVPEPRRHRVRGAHRKSDPNQVGPLAPGRGLHVLQSEPASGSESICSANSGRRGASRPLVSFKAHAIPVRRCAQLWRRSSRGLPTWQRTSRSSLTVSSPRRVPLGLGFSGKQPVNATQTGESDGGPRRRC